MDMTTEVTATRTAHAGKFLSFSIGEEEYGLEILKVQEINGMMPITRVPRTPEWVRGVINLRGRVIPVVDLRLKFGLESIPDTERTCIIVVQLSRDDRTLVMGIVVDEVSEVLNLVDEQIEPAPNLGSDTAADFVIGVGKVDEQGFVLLLDIDAVLGSEEIEVVAAASV
ncbi:MAG: purine-binding chemotaxis protein CheW [bacterium]|nr:purine-binding chemotaxis protein CheW [bacterium]